MKERPVPFSGAMVKALLAGQKSQTRRIIKPQPYLAANGKHLMWDGKRQVSMWAVGEPTPNLLCPHGEIGDRLWVREPYQLLARWDDNPASEVPEDCRLPICYPWTETIDGEMREDFKFGRKRSSRFMPKWASRLTLEITDIRVQRVTEISESDAMAEGVHVPPLYADEPIPSPDYARKAFACLWDSINGDKPGADWSSNPFVFAISFRRIETETK